MRIAYVCGDPGVPVFGQKGCSNHVQEVIRAFLKTGAKVDLYTSSTDDSPPSQDFADVEVHRVPFSPVSSMSERESVAIKANSVLHRALCIDGPFDLIYERYSIWTFAPQVWARETNTVGILEVNAPLIKEQATYRGLINISRARTIAKQVFRDAGAIVAVSQEVANYIEETIGENRKIHTLPNGVDPHRFSPSQKPTIPSGPGTFTVGFVGTLKPWHGLKNLVESFTQLHKTDNTYRLLIVGEGPERNRMERVLESRSLSEAVHFTGAVEAKEIPGLLASMDVGVAPYSMGDTFYFSPLKVFEYMAAGLPVVASRIGQLEWVIRSGHNGILVTPGDGTELAGALNKLRGDQKLRNSLGRAARQTAVDKHSWESVVRRIFAIAKTVRSDLSPIGNATSALGVLA